jgi:hypothetical protein
MFDLHHKNTQVWRFPPICLCFNVSSIQHAGPSIFTLNPRTNSDWSDKQQPRELLAEWIKLSLKCPDVSLSFECSEFDYSVGSTQENHWIILVDSSINPYQYQFRQIKEVEHLFRHMVHHTWVHAWSRANFVKHGSLKPVHTVGCSRSSRKDTPQRSPRFSCPAIAAPQKSHIQSESERFKLMLIIQQMPANARECPQKKVAKKGGFESVFHSCANFVFRFRLSWLHSKIVWIAAILRIQEDPQLFDLWSDWPLQRVACSRDLVAARPCEWATFIWNHVTCFILVYASIY